MSTVNDILEGGFEAHARALPAGGGLSGDRSRSVLRSIHRKRTTRAAAAAGGSVLGVGAIALGAMHWWPPVDLQPAVAPSWCDLSTYPRVNPDALGAAPYLGRFYEDFVSDVYVFVAPDGSRQTPALDSRGYYGVYLSDGTFVIEGRFVSDRPAWMTLRTTDVFTRETGYAQNLADGSSDPGLAYEWTTVVPETVPPGLDVAALSSELTQYFHLGGAEDVEKAVPEGAVVEVVFRWVDGRERATPAVSWDASAAVPDATELASVSIRVSNLPDGGVFEITSTYDPSKTWQVACWPYREGASPSASATVSPNPSPSLSGSVGPTPSPGVSQGGFDPGPTPSPSCVMPSPSASGGVPPPGASPTPTT